MVIFVVVVGLLFFLLILSFFFFCECSLTVSAYKHTNTYANRAASILLVMFILRFGHFYHLCGQRTFTSPNEASR